MSIYAIKETSLQQYFALKMHTFSYSSYALFPSFEKEGFSEIDVKKQAFAAILPELRKELGNVYMDRLQWMMQVKRDPVHRKIMKTRDAFVAEMSLSLTKLCLQLLKRENFSWNVCWKTDNTSPTKMMMMKTTLACLRD